ncbi:DUF2577 family protein [Clostridium sp.]|uniref:DUF2577 family protein n=1 Tax=Clostridium sp. TaxID=1506 RepID=UPI003996378A
MAWQHELAREFKKRNNNSKLGALVGKIISTNPVRISLLNGQVIAQNNIYICNSVLLDDITLDVDYNLDNIAEHGTVNTSGNLTIKNEYLKNTDLVLVICSEDNRTFFVIDKVRKVS